MEHTLTLVFQIKPTFAAFPLFNYLCSSPRKAQRSFSVGRRAMTGENKETDERARMHEKDAMSRQASVSADCALDRNTSEWFIKAGVLKKFSSQSQRKIVQRRGSTLARCNEIKETKKRAAEAGQREK